MVIIGMVKNNLNVCFLLMDFVMILLDDLRYLKSRVKVENQPRHYLRSTVIFYNQ